MESAYMATTEKKKFKKVRLHKVAKELNLTVDTIVDHLEEQGYASVLSGKGINAAITDEEAYLDLLDFFAEDLHTRSRVQELRAARQAELAAALGEPLPDVVAIKDEEPEPPVEEAPVEEPVVEEAPVEEAPVEAPVAEEAPEVEEEVAAPETVEAPVAEVEAPVAEAPEAEVVEAPEVVEEAAPVAEKPPAEVEGPAEPVEAVEEPVVEEVEAPAEEAPAEEVEEAPVAEAEVPVEEIIEIPEEDEEDEESDELITADRYKLQGTKVLGKLDLAKVDDKKPTRSRRKRKRKRKAGAAADAKPEEKAVAVEKKEKAPSKSSKRKKKRKPKVDSEDVQQTLQETLRELEQGAARLRQRRRRARRQQRAEERETERLEKEEQEKVLRVTEFVSTGELADLMGVSVTEVISMLFSAGMVVSINQRLDADTIQFVADDFGFEVEFITEFGTEDIEIEEDDPEDLQPRAPVVTVMGHVDHGKTSLLDFVRSANVVAGESGGITQHIGAYQVELQNGREVTFLDTPGHEAFTAMRARGAKVTDVVILVVAADDAVMPQTVEAINHARAAEVPIIVAINKIDLPDANPQRVLQQLAEQGVLVEQYGGTVQCAEVSAKSGQGVEDLLDKVLLEADLMELQGNPDRHAQGVIIESRLDKGRGNIATVLVQNGTLNVGDPFVAGIYSGRVRAMFDERDHRIEIAGPSEPALVLGLTGQPSVGDQFIGLDDESEAREIAQRRQQIHREQKLRQYKHVRLEDIGRRMALGDFSELNLIIKADVGGSVEAISDSLLKLSTDEVAVNIIHSGVGAINESDVMLASASDAVIIGFQVRPTAGARAAGEREEIDIHTYSIIYDAIEDVRDALEGLLTPEESEKINGVAEVRELFKVPKVGTIAGSYVTEGKIRRNDTVHIVREGVVIYGGKISSLRRFKEDVREVQSGYECGIGIENYNDLKVGDQIEAYEIVETKRKLEV